MILFTRTHGHELAPIAGELMEDTDILDGDVASGNQPYAEQVTDPFGILLGVLISLDGGNPRGTGNDDVDGGRFENIPDGDPVLAGTLHTDILAVVFKEPMFEVKQTAVKGGETLLLVLGKDAIGRSDDCGNEKCFVHIDTAIDR